MPRYTYEGDASFVDESWKEIDNRTAEVERMKKFLGINQLIKTFDLSNGSVLYVVSMEHSTNVHVVAPNRPGPIPPPPTRQREPYLYGKGVPDYVCGAVTSRVIEEVVIGYDDEMNPITQDQITALNLTELGQIRTPMEIAKPKLAIPENSYFVSGFEEPTEIRYSQHRNVRPALYTGSMRKLVQVLLGIGIQTQDTYERRQAELEGGVPVAAKTIEIEFGNSSEFFVEFEKAKAEMAKKQTESAYNLYDPTATDLVKVELYYDWRVNRTHGIHIGTTLKYNEELKDYEEVPRAYVVEIGARGVSAWLLDLDPYSETPEGRAQYEKILPELFEATDDDSFFARFGGFPSPASPPRSTEMFDELVRAGEIVQALDPAGVNEIYSKVFFSTGMGWAYNNLGTEAHNTCYSYDASGLRVGHHYMITLNAHPLAEPIEEAPNAATLIAKLKLTDWKERKARRLTEEQIDDILEAEDVKQAFDDAVAQPSFRFDATIREQRKGFLYHPARLVPTLCHLDSGQPQWKVWEPVLGYEISFDFGVDDEHKPESPPVCDAPLFVCWNKQGGLTVLNYSWRDEEIKPGEYSTTREECQYDGTWVESQPNEGERTHGNFYSNEWDPREVRTGGGWKATTTGTFMGTQVCFAFFDYFGQCCKVDLNYHYNFYTEREITGSEGMIISTAWPKGDRSAVYMAKYDYKKDNTVIRSNTGTIYVGHGAKYSYGRIYEFVFHWTGFSCPPEGPGCPPQDYICRMRPICPLYRDYAHSCFDGAPEFPEYHLMCENARIVGGTNQVVYYSRCDGELPQVDAWSVVDPLVNEYSIEVRIFGDNPMHNKQSHYDHVKGEGFDQYDLLMSPWWLKPSPDACDAKAYLHVNTSEFGNELMGYEPQFDANAKFVGLPLNMHVGLQSCYVGYVAEGT